MAAAFTKAGIDFFSVIRGRSDTDVELAKVIPPMFTPASPHLEFAGWVKKQVDVPVMHASKAPTPGTTSPSAFIAASTSAVTSTSAPVRSNAR